MNEGLARVAVAAFCTQLNPTLEEVADLKTAVSEAVTNCIIHAYEGKMMQDQNDLQAGRKSTLGGCGWIREWEFQISARAMEPLFTTKPEKDRSGMGFTFMEAFMDEVKVESQVGKGTSCPYEKGDREVEMDHTLALIKRSHQGDKEARDTLFRENTGLIYSTVKRFQGRGVEREDLFQIGSIGLLKAVDHFDTSFEVKFSTYAVPMIIGEIKRYLRDDGILKVSRSLKENCVRICRSREELEKRLGREPGVAEIAAALELPVETVVISMEAAAEVDSLQKIICQGEGSDISLLDRLPEKVNGQEQALNRIFLDEMLGKLEAQERLLIYMRYYRDMTQTEIGEKMGISQVQVSRMEKRILQKLKKEYG